MLSEWPGVVVKASDWSGPFVKVWLLLSEWPGVVVRVSDWSGPFVKVWLLSAGQKLASRRTTTQHNSNSPHTTSLIMEH